MTKMEQVMSPLTYQVLANVRDERLHQEQLKAAGRFKNTCSDPISDFERLAILGEEYGEAARAALERAGSSNDVHGADLEKELIQIAAVAVAWVEGLRKEGNQ